MWKMFRMQTLISPLYAAKAHRTLSVLPTWVNQIINTSLDIISKITKTFPVEHIDVSQLKIKEVFPLAVPIFNMPDKIDIPFDVDVL